MNINRNNTSIKKVKSVDLKVVYSIRQAIKRPLQDITEEGYRDEMYNQFLLGFGALK